MPTFSVIIPTYNRAQLVAEAVHSVLAQSFRDFELIVIDDGSTDGTAQILDSLNGEVPALNVVHLARNRGKGAAVRAAVCLEPPEPSVRHRMRLPINFPTGCTGRRFQSSTFAGGSTAPRVDHAEEVSLRVRQDHEILIRLAGPEHGGAELK